MLCIQCKGATKVIDKRGDMRRRQCQNIACGCKFVTEESVSDKYMPRSNAEAARIAAEGQAPKARQPRAVEKSKPVTKAPARVEFAQPSAAVSQPKTNERPASFFGRESLVAADVPVTVIEHTPAAAPSFAWLPKLPPAAQGRMR